MQKRFIVFLVISVGILYGSNYFFNKSTTEIRRISTPQTTVGNQSEAKTVRETSPKTQPTPEAVQPAIKGTIRALSTDRLELEINDLGAIIEKAVVKNFNQQEDDYLYIHERGESRNLGLIVELGGKTFDLSQVKWDFSKKEKALVYQHEVFKDFFIEKKISFDPGDYFGTVQIRLINRTDNPYSIKNMQVQWGPELGNTRNNYDRLSAVVMQDGKIHRINSTKKQKETEFLISQGWAALRNQYFCSILSSQAGVINKVIVRNYENQGIGLTFEIKDQIISEKSENISTIELYIGPQNYTELSKSDNNLQKIVDFGIFSFIGVWMLFILKFFYQITNNYGSAIILLTLLIRGLLWWPTQKSYTSMKKMQTSMNKMQPRLKTLKELYRDNPQKLNEETLKLYREYQINPMGGCLPMLLQMPVFFALYSTLSSAVELKGAEFIWVWKDLSAKDPSFILPIAMGLSMFVQQKISTPPAATPEAATQQKMMLYMMPLMLTFFAFIWPSGLLLYWVMSNLISIGQQVLINRRA